MEQAGFREEWIAYLSSGVDLATANQDNAASAEFALQIAILYRMISEYERAVAWLTTSIEGFRQLGDRRGEARALNEQPWVEQLRRRYDDASQHVEQALALIAADDPERGMCYRVKGMIAIHRGEWETAEAHHRAALASFERQGDKRKVAWSIVNLGLALRGQKKFEEAVKQFEQACAMMNQSGDSYHWATSQTNLGLTYFYMEDHRRAIECYLRAEAIAQLSEDRLRIADLQVNLGLAYLRLNSTENSAQSFIQASQIYEKLGLQSLQVNSLDGLAMTYIAQRQYRQALEVLDVANALLPQIVNVPNYQYYQKSIEKHWLEAKNGETVSFIQTVDIA